MELQTAIAYKKKDGGYVLSKEAALKSYGEHKCKCGTDLKEMTTSTCYDCRMKEITIKEREKISKIPTIEWDGKTPLYIDDTFIFSEDDLHEFFEDQEDGAYAFLVCEPIHLQQVDEDYWQDCFGEDGELPDEVSEALNKLNEVIKKQGPTAWEPGYRQKVILKKSDYTE